MAKKASRWFNVIALLGMIMVAGVYFTATGCSTESRGRTEGIGERTDQAKEFSEETRENKGESFREDLNPEPALEIARILSGHDQDGDGLDDLEDIVKGARDEAFRKPTYKSEYYSGGYPPDSEGVCTDVIWRAFKEAGYNLKDMVDADIKGNMGAYPRVEGRPDPNIDFRRVPNLVSFFNRHAQSLTTEIIPGDEENLVQWQGGDIVVYGAPLWHIGIVSDRRREDGVPLLIHNGGPFASESDVLMDWPSPIINHFRFPKVEN